MIDPKRAQVLSIRLWMNCLATQETLCVYLGIRLGLYVALAQTPSATPAELARRGGIAVRYAREWLEQQAVSGIVRVERVNAASEESVYSLPAEHAEVLTESDSPWSRVAGILPVGAVAHALPELLSAYRSGRGLTDKAYGPDWRTGHGGANRALYSHELPNWVKGALPDIHRRLTAERATIADFACGAGWSAIALAKAYPKSRITGFEIDHDLVQDAQENAREAGADNNLRFEVRDCVNGEMNERFDLVCVLDTVHEIAAPARLLANSRQSCKPGGCVFVMDARTEDRFTAPANEVERFQYTTSVLHCLPVSLSDTPSAAIGTILRIPHMLNLAKEAGFERMDVLPIADRFHRFYRFGV